MPFFFPKTIEAHRVLSSTSDRVSELLKQSVLPELPCLVLARRQTTGRGRDGKIWWSAPGALLMSLGVEAESLGLDRRDFSLLSIVVALTLVETLRGRLPPERPIELHWPNDVYVDGKKISGILIESPGPRHLVIGIGVNVNNSLVGIPTEFLEELGRRSVTSLIDLLGKKTDIPTLIVDFLLRFHYKVGMMVRDRASLIGEARRCCAQLGRKVTIQDADRTVTGLCLDLTETGALRLKTPEGEILVSSGTRSSST